MEDFFVGPLGLEPRLFGTKNQRVASYTMGHCLKMRMQIYNKVWFAQIKYTKIIEKA